MIDFFKFNNKRRAGPYDGFRDPTLELHELQYTTGPRAFQKSQHNLPSLFGGLIRGPGSSYQGGYVEVFKAEAVSVRSFFFRLHVYYRLKPSPQNQKLQHHNGHLLCHDEPEGGCERLRFQ